MVGDVHFKLGDIYDGYSMTTTRELSIPDAVEQERTAQSGEANKEVIEEVAVTNSNASKKKTFLTIGIIIAIVIAVGAMK